MQLALMNSRTLMAVQELDRIFNRDDVIELRFIDQIDDGCESRTLATAGWTGHQHDTGLQLDNLEQLLRQTKIFEARRPRRDHAHYDCIRSALLENVDAKSIYPGQAERNIDRAHRLKIFGCLGVVANDDFCDR